MSRNSGSRNGDGLGAPQVPAASVLTSIGAFDALTVLPSGVFTFVVTYMVLSAHTLSDGELTLWLRLQQMVADTLRNPLILLAVLFVSYFFGSVLRAFPVEWVVSALHVGRRRCPRRRATDGEGGHGRRLTFRVRRAAVLKPRRPDVIPKAIIDEWKGALSLRSPEAYAHYRTFEAKSRFAAAMLWAGLLGVVGSAVYIAVIGLSVAVSQLGLISLLLTAVFGSLLPRACRQEVSALLILSETTRRAARG